MATDGPFEPYPVTGGVIRAAAEQAGSQGRSLDELESVVVDRHRESVDAVDDVLEGSMASAVDPVTGELYTVGQVSYYAQGALNTFAIAVDAFNETSEDPMSIARLNQVHADMAAANFGVDRTEFPDDDSFEDARDQAASNLVGHLLGHWERLHEDLDAAAEEVQKLLARGPNETDIRAMFRAGALSIYTANDFDQVTFTPGDWKAHVIHQLQAGELLDLGRIPPGILDSLRTDAGVMAAARQMLTVDATLGELDADLLSSGQIPAPEEMYATYYRLFWTTASAEFAQLHEPAAIPSGELAYLQSFYATSLADGQEAAWERLRRLDSAIERLQIIAIPPESPLTDIFRSGLTMTRDAGPGGEVQSGLAGTTDSSNVHVEAVDIPLKQYERPTSDVLGS